MAMRSLNSVSDKIVQFISLPTSGSSFFMNFSKIPLLIPLPTISKSVSGSANTESKNTPAMQINFIFLYFLKKFRRFPRAAGEAVTTNPLKAEKKEKVSEIAKPLRALFLTKPKDKRSFNSLDATREDTFAIFTTSFCVKNFVELR